nr:reverse transcriptase domain-containing protein [Tanacetum cinerariifolium]
RSNRRRVPNIVEPEICTTAELVPLADRTMEKLLHAPTEGYGEDIIIPKILAENFEIKTNLLQDNVSKTDDRINKLVDQISNLVVIVNKQVITPASAKAVEKTCVTYGGAHAYYDCIATDNNQPSVCAATGSYNQASPPNRASHQIPQLGFTPVQNNPISFADALLLMPKFASTNKSLLTNKDKLFELAKVPLSENCSAMLLKKLPEKVRGPGKFLIPCDFPGMEVCHALADLGASINVMPLSIWKKLSLPELTPTRMNLELADRSITHPKGVVEDVFVKVGKFHFPTDFVVVDFEADPRVPLILGRSFLRTNRALIDVYREEITLRVNDESITFNLNQTIRYSSTYDDNSVNRVDVIDIACEEFVQDVLDFQYSPKSSNPTLVSDPTILENDFCKEPILKSSSPTLIPFGESDFFLEEIEDFLNDDSIPMGIESSVYDPEEDILFLEKILNEDPFLPPPMDLKHVEETKAKSSNEEPTELELKELPSHLDLKVSQKAIAWKISDIKGIDPRFCTHKILMEEDYKPIVQSQRRVNPKIHDVIKKKVIKLLDADMIYPISDSPWVSLIHCVPKKGCMTVVANENNELIPTRLVTGWRVFIDYRKLNDATRKDHFPLPFMDQMLERLVGNKEGIVLGHKILMSGIEVDRAKVDVIANLPHPTTIKGVRSFLGHAEVFDILKAFHEGPTGGHHGANLTAKKSMENHAIVQLNELSELRDQPYKNSVIYKERTKKFHDSKIKNRIFNVGDQVLLFNSRLKIFFGKLKTRWSGPFTITLVFPYGTVELSQPNGPNFKVNGHLLKHYFGGDIPSNVVPNLHTFPMDK